MKKLLVVLAFWMLPTLAFAQCNGIFPNNTFCGNNSGAPAPPAPIAFSGSIIGPGSTTPGDLVTWANSSGTLLGDSGIGSTTTGSGSLVLQTSPALLGVPTAPTAAPLTNTTQIATTAFVLANSGANCATLGAFPVGIGGAVQCSNVFSSTATLNGGTLSVIPAANTYTQGINISQSGPTSGSTSPSTGNNFNLLALTGYNATTTCGSNTNPFADHGYWCNSVNLFRANLNVGGSNVSAGPGASGGTIAAIIGHTTLTTAVSTINDFVGMGGITYSNVANSGTGGLFGGGSQSVCDGCTTTSLVGHEAEVAIINAGTATSRVGVNILNGGTVQASSTDSAINVGSGNSGGNFVNLFTAPNVKITWSGNTTLGSSANSTGLVFLNPAANGVNSGTSIELGNAATVGLGSTGTILYAAANEAGRTTVRYGITLGNYAEISAFNSDLLGFIIGTNTNVPLIFGANNVFAGGINGSQQWTVGPNAAPQTDVKLTVNTNTNNPIGHQSGLKVPAQFVGVDSANNALLIDTFSTSPAESFLTFRRARGTMASFNVVQNGDNLGAIGFVGAVSTSAFAAETGGQGGVFISATATETWGANNQGSKLTVFTTPNGASTVASAMVVNSNGNVFIGSAAATTTTGVSLTVSRNTATTLPSVSSGTMMETIQADNVINRSAMIAASSTGGLNVMNFYSSRGTVASPSATQSGDTLWAFGGFGYGTSYQTGGGAAIIASAAENLDGTHGGTNLVFQTTATGGSVSSVNVLRFEAGGGITLFNIGTGAGNGAMCGATNVVNSTGGALTYDSGANCIVSLRGAKRDIEPLGPILDEVMQLTPVQFRYREGQGDSGRHEQVGLIAQDVAIVDPRLAAYNDSGELVGVRYSQSIAIAIKAIQELKSDNDNLRAEVMQLREAIGR